jgi:hypothetical protein
MRQTLAVWDEDSYSGTIYYDGVQVSGGLGSNASVTYSTNVGLTLFAAPDGSDGLQNAVFEGFVLINQTAANRVTAAQWLMSQSSLASPLANYAAGDGFVYKPELLAAYPAYANSFGDYTFSDAEGITFAPQQGGYYGPSGPSLGIANNVNNGGTQYRFVDQQGDSDIVFNQSERAEMASTTARITPGQYASYFVQFKWESYTSQNGDWCYQNQIHYDNGSGNPSTPDIFAISCKNGQLQVIYQNGSTTTNCGSPITLTQGVAYALEVEIKYAVSGSDGLDVWIGTNGTSLTHQCTASGALNPTDTGAYLKLGVYRGYPYSNNGTLVLDEMNEQWSNTANAFSAYRTTQPALPTHP